MLSVNVRIYISLALLLSVFCHVETLRPSHHCNTTVHGLNNETRCSWHCRDIHSYLMAEMKTIIARNKIIRFNVKYEVMEECVNQTSGNSTEHFEIWRANKQSSGFTKALKSVVNLMSCTNSVEESKEITGICTSRPVNTTGTEPTDYNCSSPIFSRIHLVDLGVKFDSIECIETTDNLQPCISITKSTGNKSTTFEGLLKRCGWPNKVLLFLHVVFVAIFTYYSSAFLCLFSPTEVTEDGVHPIVLDGAGPVSLRSLMGNYFFSKDDTICHRVRMFILRAVLLPFPFLGLAIFAEYVQQNESLTFNVLGISYLLHPFMAASYVCYYIMTFCTSFYSAAGSSGGSHPCIVCKHFRSKTLICQENLTKRMKNHLRIQPLILIECSRLFTRLLLTYFKRCFLLILSTFELSCFFFLRLFLLIVLLSASPAVTIILLITILLKIFSALLYTSPLFSILSDTMTRRLYALFRHNRRLLLLSLSLCILIYIPAFLGPICLLAFAGFGVSIAIILAFVLLLSEESLPFVACFVLVLYYFWSSYSSFTNKYQDLGLALFKHYQSYKKSRHSQVTDVNLLENTQNAAGDKDIVMKIPKELFHLAYEELMPIRESVCVLILKVTIIVSFVLFVFSLVMLLNVSATPVMRALLTFLSGSLPKIVAIYMDGRRQKNIEDMTADEKIPLIVQEYIERISAVNQEQQNSGADVDEVMLQNVNEEIIEIAII